MDVLLALLDQLDPIAVRERSACSPPGTDDPVFRGHDGVKTFMRGWISSFDEWEPTIERLVEAGDDVIAVVSDVAYLKGSRMPIRRRYAHAFTFRDDRVVRSRIYSDPAEAIESIRPPGSAG